ncbi:MAG: D-alanyl-D-alanine carboxypeptidase [Thermoleophilaceae bacterium]|nr:D-alanyl-D-alanine carboxypeptidase [Thermoleophilaceae bacterium]
MIARILLAFVLLALGVLVALPAAQAQRDGDRDRDRGFELDFSNDREIKPRLSGREPTAGLLFDADNGDVLWSRKARGERPIASLTKVMSALVAVDKLDPRDDVKISSGAAATPPVKIGLKGGTKVPAETLLEGMLVASGNDAAVALAEGAEGSTRKFVREMDRHARELDLDCTSFDTPSGLSPDDRSCPEDLAELSVLALGENRIARVVRQRKAKLDLPGRGKVKLSATNPLLRERYKGTIGLKTGFTNAAGRCLIAVVKRGAETLVAILLDSPDTGRQAKELFEEAR